MYDISWYDVISPVSMLGLIAFTALMAWLIIFIRELEMRVIFSAILFVVLTALIGIQHEESANYQASLNYVARTMAVVQENDLKINPAHKGIVEDYQKSPSDPSDWEENFFYLAKTIISLNDFKSINNYMAACTLGSSLNKRLEHYPATKMEAQVIIQESLQLDSVKNNDNCTSIAWSILSYLK